jgi:hypothetical protein
LKFLRVLQVFDNLFELLLGFIDARNVLERDAADLFGKQTCPALAEPHRTAAAALHLAHKKDPYPDQQQHREPGNQYAEQ